MVLLGFSPDAYKQSPLRPLSHLQSNRNSTAFFLRHTNSCRKPRSSPAVDMLITGNVFNGLTLQQFTFSNDKNSSLKLFLSSSTSSGSLHLLRRKPNVFPLQLLRLPHLRKKMKKLSSSNLFVSEASVESTGDGDIATDLSPHKLKIPVGDRHVSLFGYSRK